MTFLLFIKKLPLRNYKLQLYEIFLEKDNLFFFKKISY